MGNMFKLTKFSLFPAAVVVFAGYLPAQMPDDQPGPAPRVSLYGDPHSPNISGLWLGTAMGIPGQGAITNSGSSGDGRPPTYWAPWPLPYTPAYQRIYDERVAAAKQGRQLGDISAKCLPFGLPMMLASKVYPDEIIQTPGEVTITGYSGFPITIWTDGRSHPKDLAPTYYGHSIGHWVGDTLFVDTVAILGTTPIDANRNPHSPKLHMKWTIQRVAQDVLHFDLTLYDDEAFNEPVTMTNIWHRKSGSEWQILDDSSCFENNDLVPPPPAAKGFIKF